MKCKLKGDKITTDNNDIKFTDPTKITESDDSDGIGEPSQKDKKIFLRQIMDVDDEN